MSTVTIVLLVILVILIAAVIALYFFGKKAQKKQDEQQAQIQANKQTVSMLVIDKKLYAYIHYLINAHYIVISCFYVH